MNALMTAYPKDYGANVNGVWVSANATYNPSPSRKRQSTTAGSSALVCGAYSEILRTAINAPHPYAMLAFVAEKAGPVFAPYNCTDLPMLGG